jgi:hypothetical protein
MTVRDQMDGIRTRLETAGSSISALCREAELARSTWDRWYRGETEPNFRSWNAIKAAADRLAPPVAGNLGEAAA